MNEMKIVNTARVMEDPETEKYCFADQMEFILYVNHCMDEGKKNAIAWSSDSSYFDLCRKGSDFFEDRQYGKALRTYQDALKVNPVGIGARFEICECYLRLGLLPGARQTLLDMQEYLVTATDVARFYRRMGFIETEQCNYRLAVACFLFSLRYEESEVVKNELTYITAVTGKIIRIANLEAALKRAGLPILEAYRVTDENFVSRRIEKVEIV